MAVEFLMPPELVNYWGPAYSDTESEPWKDLHYIRGMMRPVGKNSIPKNPEKFGINNNIHLYEIISLECNAACLEKNGEIELGMFMGLRDVIYTFSKFTVTDPRIFESIGNVSLEKERDYSLFPEPVGFQNITRCIGDKLEYYPNKSYEKLWSSVQPKENTRLLFGEIIRLSSELFVWFHELYHVWRYHFHILKNIGESRLTMTETYESDSDKANLYARRCLEHDADRMSLVNLIENIKQEKGSFYSLIKLLGSEGGYRALFYGMFCSLTVLMISQIISNSVIEKTHPSIFKRIIYLSEFIKHAYDQDDIIQRAFSKAIHDWGTAYELFGWKSFVDGKVQIINPSDEEIIEYYNQVNQTLKPIDEFFSKEFTKPK